MSLLNSFFIVFKSIHHRRKSVLREAVLFGFLFCPVLSFGQSLQSLVGNPDRSTFINLELPAAKNLTLQEWYAEFANFNQMGVDTVVVSAAATLGSSEGIPCANLHFPVVRPDLGISCPNVPDRIGWLFTVASNYPKMKIILGTLAPIGGPTALRNVANNQYDPKFLGIPFSASEKYERVKYPYPYWHQKFAQILHDQFSARTEWRGIFIPVSYALNNNESSVITSGSSTFYGYGHGTHLIYNLVQDLRIFGKTTLLMPVYYRSFSQNGLNLNLDTPAKVAASIKSFVSRTDIQILAPTQLENSSDQVSIVSLKENMEAARLELNSSGVTRLTSLWYAPGVSASGNPSAFKLLADQLVATYSGTRASLIPIPVGADRLTTFANLFTDLKSYALAQRRQPVSITPAHGVGNEQEFTLRFKAPKAGLRVGNLLINYGLDGAASCYLAYLPDHSLLVLVGDDISNGGSASVCTEHNAGFCASNAILSNKQCSINTAGARVIENTDDSAEFALKVPISFKPGFSGPKGLWMAARNDSFNSSWLSAGVWEPSPSTIQIGSNPLVLATARTLRISQLSMARGLGPAQKLSFTVTNPGSNSDTGVVNVLINGALDGSSACYVAYSVPDNTIYLVTDKGDDLVYPGALGNGVAQTANSQCTVKGTVQAISPNQLKFDLSVAFGPKWTSLSPESTSPKYIYIGARDIGEKHSSGWHPRGTLIPAAQ